MLAHSCSPHPCLHQPHSLIHTTSLRGPPRRHHMRNRSSSADSVHAQWGQQQQPEQANQHTEGHPSAASTPSSARSMRRLVRQLLLMLHCNKRMVQLSTHQSVGGVSRAGVLALNEMAIVGLALPVLPGNGLQDLLANRVLVTGFCAWFAAQFGKIFTWRFKKGVWNVRAMVQPGGMPSSHSSLCAGVTTALALQEGLSSPLFAVSLAFSVIVMYDAMGVRQHAGKQAAVLNQVVTEVFQKNPSIGDIKLKEVLGHTPRQVLCGAMLGFIVAMCFPWGPSTPQ